MIDTLRVSRFLAFLTGVSLFFPMQSFAQDVAVATPQKPLDEVVSDLGITIVFFSAILLLSLIVVSYKKKHTSENAKKSLFLAIAATILLPTLFLVLSTIYVNVQSSSKGPVHWHADIEIWACGKEIDLKDPKGLSNKIGTSTFHEHNDKRIHVEGVVMEPQDVSLARFFHVIGGSFSQDGMTVPTVNGVKEFANGGMCEDTTTGEIQTFVYRVDGDTYTQEKLEDAESYLMSPYGTIPPGDCVIIEYGMPKDQTEKLCKSYEVAERIGKIRRIYD